MTLNDLTVNFEHVDSNHLLSDWEWLIGKTKLPILLLASGDAFVQDVNDQAVYFLDVGFGSIEKVSDSINEFQSLLTKKDFVVDHFGVNMVGDLIQNDVVLKKGQIYSLDVPLSLGGEYELKNISPTDIEVHFSVAGQIHRQLKDLPEGTVIKEFKIVDGTVKLG